MGENPHVTDGLLDGAVLLLKAIASSPDFAIPLARRLLADEEIVAISALGMLICLIASEANVDPYRILDAAVNSRPADV